MDGQLFARVVGDPTDAEVAAGNGSAIALLKRLRTLLGTVSEPSRAAIVDRSGTIAAGGISQQLAAANATRRYLLIQNVSTGDLWFTFGPAAAVLTQPSLKLAAGASYEMTGAYVASEAIQIIGGGAGQAFSAREA